MPKISRSALVPYSAQQMYQLVNDVSSYPQFLPGCTGSRIITANAEEMTAAVDVSKAGISKTFPDYAYCSASLNRLYGIGRVFNAPTKKLGISASKS